MLLLDNRTFVLGKKGQGIYVTGKNCRTFGTNITQKFATEKSDTCVRILLPD